MSDTYEPRRKQNNRARERQRRRQERSMATPHSTDEVNLHQRVRSGQAALSSNRWLQRGRLLIQDSWWYLRNTPLLAMGIGVVIGFYFVLFAASHVVQGRIFPSVSAFGVYIGDMTADEAKIALLQAWNNDVRIRLVDEDRSWLATTSQLGLTLDVDPVVEAAQNVGLAGIPFGWNVEPVIQTEIITLQNFLLDLSQQVEIPPFNGGYQLQGDRVVGLSGSEGKMLDVGLTLEVLDQNMVSTIMRRQADLIMQPLMPDFVDPEPYLDDVSTLVNQPFQLVGYDPYYDESVAWSTTPETLVTWLEAGSDGLTLREESFIPFLEAQTASLNSENSAVRFLEPSETLEKMRQAIENLQSEVNLRVRYRPTIYEVQAGDLAFSIARKTGIPFYLIEQVNPGKDLNVLSPGDLLNLPSRDEAVPLEPVKNKRIIVDIDSQSLVAYENGEVVFSWLISTGVATAPTSPGVYQILSHDPIASGGSYTLCGEQGCGQWKMHWFMGLYEVTPGLMNGFHGAVELPNGAYLGGGNVGAPYTFGCVMSLDSNAQQLYEWAEVGTPVEIISGEYQPQSELGKRAFPV